MARERGLDGDEEASLFGELARYLYAADDYGGVCAALCAAAVRLVPGCGHASLIVRLGNRYLTAAASDEIARLADQIEREHGEGPCLDAIAEDTAQLDPDLTVGSAWPSLARELLKRTPIRGAIAFRLLIDRRRSGALNLFSDRPNALNSESINHGALLAAFASVTLIAASQKDAVANLRVGLTSNREIGKAIGLMMAFHKVSDGDAFAILRKTSQEMNIKLAEVARELVAYHNQAAQPGPGAAG